MAEPPYQPPPPGQPGAYYPPPPASKKSGTPTWLIVLIVVPGALIVLGGICAAIAIPSFTKYMRRSKTSEARVQLAKMFDSVAAYQAEFGDCPTDGNMVGRAGTTPPFAVECGSGPGGRCVPDGAGAGAYPAEAWSQNPVWQKLGFHVQDGHYFHYDYRWGKEAAGCKFTVQAFGDLDDDGVFSTFERSGAIDGLGVNAAAGLYIDNEVE